MSTNPYALGSVGQLVTRGMVENRVTKHVQNCIVPYLAEVERQNNIGPRCIQTPRSWRVRTEFERLPEDSMPFISVISPGTNTGRSPRRDGDGLVTAWWVVGIGAVVTASDPQLAKDLAGYYGAAIRGLMTQIPELGGYDDANGDLVEPWASAVEWEDESYDDWPVATERTIAAVRCAFTIEVQDALNVFGGFRDMEGNIHLPDAPYDNIEPYPPVKEYEITVDESSVTITEEDL